MIKKSLIFSLAVVCLSAVASHAEDVKITTYYPSPYGVYKGISSTDKTTLATDNLATNPNSKLLVGATTPPSGSTAKLYVLGSVEGDAFRAYEFGGVYAFIEAGAADWTADMGGYDDVADAFAKTRLDGAPLLLQTRSFGNVGIGTEPPSSSAKLEVSSTNQGFLPPRVTGTGSVTPVAGLIIYDTSTTPGVMKYYNGTAWVPMGGAAAGHIGVPAYDSGWFSYSGPGSVVKDHNLGTDNTIVVIEFKASPADWVGINNIDGPWAPNGGAATYVGWINKTSNQITL